MNFDFLPKYGMVSLYINMNNESLIYNHDYSQVLSIFCVSHN